ncbi:MAG: hypothetical protein DKM23_00130 [Candidatus Melainabacteria bacterium]|jgi:predicted ribosome quality control (RQC) complex YloA/Tae2 family protein|nr:MAG: hypothetical protein DKM24_02580 [Candidatus Melainabacteria bacterium]RAI13476.1 MAG: hypothetical protein DKM23_00130 [Candidatus Melainabacteria bacterium]
MSENFDLDTGKNIVDALKADTEDEVLEVKEDAVELEAPEAEEDVMPTFADEEETTTEKFDSSMKPSSDFENNMADDTFQHAVVENYANDLYNFEVPNNVAVLKKLIAKLPSGVTRQTGAQIIKQTMEALGISMKSVLQEAQQLQEQLSSSTKECQATISEYKRQIVTLEEQAQSYKKQYNNLNELVSLFINTEN